VGLALLNGTQSIVDPVYKGEGSPIWMVQYWDEMHIVAEVQAAWRRSNIWLQKYSTGTSAQPDIDQAQKHLSSLAWQGRTLMPGGSTYTTTRDFATLLSNQMLTTTLVDIMVEHIADYVRADEDLSEKFKVVSLVFMNNIEKATSLDDYKKKSLGFLHKLEGRLKGSSKILLFPVHLPLRVYFDAFEIDYKK